jgi:hypothetical protein
MPEAAYEIHGRFTDDQRKGVFKPETSPTAPAQTSARVHRSQPPALIRGASKA